VIGGNSVANGPDVGKRPIKRTRLLASLHIIVKIASKIT
jgi:hypothetical protein